MKRILTIVGATLLISCSKNISDLQTPLRTYEFEIETAEVSVGDSIRIIQTDPKGGINMSSPFIKPINGKNTVKFQFLDIPNWVATLQIKSDNKIIDIKSELIR